MPIVLCTMARLSRWTGQKNLKHFEDEDVRNLVRDFHLENPHLPMDRRVTL